MALETLQDPLRRPLQIVNLNGGQRAGKGTTAGALLKDSRFTGMGLEVFETGIVYRTATYMLLEQGVIDPDMSKEQVATMLAPCSEEWFAELIGEGDRILTDPTNRKRALYGQVIHETVGMVSPNGELRHAVKGDLVERVVKKAETGEGKLLVFDGRKLGDVVRGIPGTKIILDIFFDCSPEEAARRETIKQFGPEYTDADFDSVLPGVLKRAELDSSRSNDPVLPSTPNINYWEDTRGINGTAVARGTTGRYWTDSHGSFLPALRNVFGSDMDIWRTDREGIGLQASASNTEVYFDTTPFKDFTEPGSVEAMVSAGKRMINEALMFQEWLYDDGPLQV